MFKTHRETVFSVIEEAAAFGKGGEDGEHWSKGLKKRPTDVQMIDQTSYMLKHSTEKLCEEAAENIMKATHTVQGH